MHCLRLNRLFFYLLICTSTWPSPVLSQSNTLGVIANISDEEKLAIGDLFEEDTKIKIKWDNFKGLKALRIQASQEASNSVIYAIDPATLKQLKLQGMLNRLKSTPRSAVCVKCTDPDHYWTGIDFSPIAFLINSRALKNHQLEEPLSWTDLKNPKYFHLIAFPSPYSYPAGSTALMTLVKVFGSDPSKSLFSALDVNVNTYNAGSNSCLKQLYMREIAICVTFAAELVKSAGDNERDEAVHINYPREGTGAVLEGAGVLRHGPDPEKAQVFINWLQSERFQKTLERWGKLPLVHSRSPFKQKGGQLRYTSVSSHPDAEEVVIREFVTVCRHRRCM